MRLSFKSFLTNVAQAPGSPVRAGFARAGAEVRAGFARAGAEVPSPACLYSCIAVLCLSVSLLHAQPAPAAPAQDPHAPPTPTEKPSISLSPAVVMAKGNFGQGLTQTLTLTNQTARDFAFELVAEDVLVKDGKRTFVPAGETPNSIAATAVFTQKTVLVKPFSSASVDVR